MQLCAAAHRPERHSADLRQQSKEAKLALYRIGDRNLIGSVVGSDFRQQISGYGAQNIADRQGKEVWAGEMDTPAPLNKDVTTAFPVDEALGKLEAGLYVMTAQPAATQVEEYGTRSPRSGSSSPTLASPPASGKDGAAGLDPLHRDGGAGRKGADVRLIARNNEVLATATHG